MQFEEVIKTLHPFETKILYHIKNDSFTIQDMSALIGLNEAQTRSGINWLEGKGLIEKKDKTIIIKETITEKGREFKTKELPEIAIYNYLNTHKDAVINDIMSLPNYDRKDIGSVFGFLKKNEEIKQEADGKLSLSTAFNIAYYSELARLLNSDKDEIINITEAQKKTIETAYAHNLHKNFFKHKESEIYSFIITENGRQIKAILIANNISGDEISQITPEILKEKSWKNKNFREYNINLPAPHILIGKKHPYREFLDFLKYKFVGLGFTEMRGPLIETEFWNMDALFMPQTHPARDIHDVYYIKEPKYAREIKEPYFTNVAKTHENGHACKSRGWCYAFDKAKAKQLILRSQGTVLSAKKLTEKPNIPGKYFSIARCFRYDKVDATHLADFFRWKALSSALKLTFLRF